MGTDVDEQLALLTPVTQFCSRENYGRKAQST